MKDAIPYSIKMPGMLKICNFGFTLNNYTAADVEAIRSLAIISRYLVFGYETAKTTGTPHLQGYCQLKDKTALNKIRRLNKWHVEDNKVDPKRSSDYCKKGGRIEEFGNLVV